MVTVKLVFLVIMTILAAIFFLTPMFFPESKSAGKGASSKRTRIVVRIRMGCFLGILILLLLCVIL